jgi:DNA-binding CsgD family transcriptional regulator
VGGIACGACWELAIRDDERFAVLFGLPRELETDPDYVDVVAVERACSGVRVHLTDAERRAAVSQLVNRGYSRTRISNRLRMSGEVVNTILADLLAELDASHSHAAAPADSDELAA